MPSLTIDRLREVLSYDPGTGLFRWLIDTAAHRLGKVAGCVSRSTGYRLIRIDGAQFRAHRLAWFYVHGTWPTSELDHIDTDRTNNRIANLRPVSDAENAQNVRRPRAHNRSGLLGVHKTKTGSFAAEISADKRRLRLGFFETPEQAHRVYLAAKERMHITGPAGSVLPPIVGS